MRRPSGRPGHFRVERTSAYIAVPIFGELRCGRLPRDPSPPPWSARFARELSELQRKQESQRFEVLTVHDLTELRALQRLAYDLWGDRGFVEVHNGIKYLGYFVDGMNARTAPGKDPGPGRPHVIPFQGASYSELHAQVRKWRTSTTA